MVQFEYVINFDGVDYGFKSLYNAWAFCDLKGIKRVKRIWEKEIQPHARGWFDTKGDCLKNRQRLENEQANF